MLHYVDEGSGDPILFVHGTPTWSFLWRDLIKEYSNDHRCIAVDHLGFGLSEKPDAFEGTPEAHSQNLLALIEELDLRNVTLVVHDFGGPIGLGAANQIPDRISRIVLFNTWLWETESSESVKKVDKILNSWLGKFMYLRMNFSPKVLLKKSFHNKSKLSKQVHRHYVKVFPDSSSRQGLLKIGMALRGSSDWYAEQGRLFEERLSDIPTQVYWGMRDPFISPEFLQRWKGILKNAEYTELETGHFVMAEAEAKIKL